jgi:hypothetical protein
MSDLRTRIIAALSRHRPRWGEWVTCTCDNDFSRFTPDTYEWHVADAVIAAIQLQPEYGHLDETDSGIIADTIPELGEPCPGETLRHRYITPWKDINETD